jgi:hypothetical protein
MEVLQAEAGTNLAQAPLLLYPAGGEFQATINQHLQVNPNPIPSISTSSRSFSSWPRVPF